MNFLTKIGEVNPLQDSPLIDVNECLREIEDHISKINDIAKKTCWPHLKFAESASLLCKMGSMKVIANYFKLTNYYLECDQNIANHYFQEGLSILQQYCKYRTKDKKLDYQYWFDLTNYYTFRVRQHINGSNTMDETELMTFLDQGLEAINSALSLQETSKGLFRKYILLELMRELGGKPPEAPLQYLRFSLDKHEDPTSEEYLENTIIYGGELAKQNDLDAAQKLFTDLLKHHKHPQVYMALGKIESTLNNNQKAITHFEKAFELDSNNLEIEIWLLAQKVTDKIEHVKAMRGFPSNEEVASIVGVFNAFCMFFPKCADHLQEKISTGTILLNLTNYFHVTLLPEMAKILTKFHQNTFALHLYQMLLDSFDAYEQEGAFDSSAKIDLICSIGTVHLQMKEYALAEKYFRQAIALKKDFYATGYQNLIVAYVMSGDRSKLDQLWIELEPLIAGIDNTDVINQLSDIYFNLGTAYAGVGKECIEESLKFYQLSLNCDPDNMSTRLHMGRILALKKDFEKACEILMHEQRSNPFESPMRDFQYYFCLAGALALKGDLGKAEKNVLSALKIHSEPEQANNLHAYLKSLKNAKPDQKEKIHAEIIESIRKIGFDYRVGKVINPESITLCQDAFVGYHGTIDTYLNDFIEGVQPKKENVRQFNGQGFYLAPDLDVAKYFAFRKSLENPGSKPIVMKVYANQGLVGKEITTHCKPMRQANPQEYDFVTSAIDGYEKFQQAYVYEASLYKLKVKYAQAEPVGWTEDDFKAFQTSWLRL